jgi:DNA-binding NarL/FixJ family response regulator
MKIFVVEDHPIVRETICRLLIGQGDVEIVGQAGSGREAVEKIQKLHPEVIVLDSNLPDVGGLDVILMLQQASPSTHIVLLSDLVQDSHGASIN